MTEKETRMLSGRQIDTLITGKAVVDGWEQRMKEWHGLRPSSASRDCPRYVARKQCQAYTPGRERECICREAEVLGLMDHMGTWLDEEGNRVFTTEPYARGTEEWIAGLAMLNGWAEQYGLVVDVSSRSPWFPTWTTLIKIRQPNRNGY